MRIVVAALLWLALAATAWAQSGAPVAPLVERLTPQVLQRVFPQATRVEAVTDNGPVAAAAYADAKLVGYIFSTLDVLRAPGYSSTPFDVVAGVSLDGKITGAALLFHREPYLLNDDRRTGLLVQFLDNLTGMDAKLGAPGGYEPTFVAGATLRRARCGTRCWRERRSCSATVTAPGSSPSRPSTCWASGRGPWPS